MMDTKYNHLEIEKGKNDKWVKKGYFSEHDKAKRPFTIILPPPNVTGKLHLGHAWDGFIQDTMIRFKKLNGFDVLWVPGTDHAGIATQAKVEERIRKEENKTRYDYGREAFLGKVWEWKEEYASTIRSQWAKLGLGLDYKQERFTMEPLLNDAVTKIFIDLYNRKLIYRGERAINWDPVLQTVLSNIEVENKETKSKMFYFNYKIKVNEPKNWKSENNDEVTSDIQVATTRPETMFSDVAIAVNPKDTKMAHFIGKKAISPLTGNILPIIGDEYIEIGKGTGAMKVSAHAEADITIIKNNDLEIKECIDKQGIMNELAMEFKGLDRFKCRDEVVKKLESSIFKVEEITNAVGYSERSGAVVETLVQPQWFVDMKPMAKLIINDLNKDGVKFFPGRFEDVLRKWMDEIQDWCISRQLWWGHRIPAWYKGEETKVQEECPGEGWVQDEDVLDTWFSSGLAPFSFLGWPQSEELLKRYYPTSLLVTGYDIIFFWVARMYFQSLDVMKEKPFEHVLIHGLIRAEDGRKMSKSLGNGIDPMDVIDQYGSDSLRWFLLTNSTPGQDIRYSEEKIRASWNLNNKLWNISRFILEIMEEGSGDTSDADQWISNKLTWLENFVDEKMDEYEFTVIGKELTKFIMDDFSSWYIEFSKATPNKKFAINILERLLKLLHPFLPFITDEIYSMINGKEILESERVKSSMLPDASYIDRVIEVVSAIREFRATQNISNKEKLQYWIDITPTEEAMVNKLSNSEREENNDAQVVVGSSKVFIKLSEELKVKEKERIAQRIVWLNREITRARGLLSNPGFVSKAPEAKLKEERDNLERFEQEMKELGGN